MRRLPKHVIAGALVLSANMLIAADGRADVAGGGAMVAGLAPAPPGWLDPECLDQTTPRRRHERTRSRLAWLFGFDRGDALERSHRSFAFYLRSPLLSGLYPCPPNSHAVVKPPEPVDACAELTITTEALEERTVQVLLPQFEARNARRLRATLEDRLAKGEIVTLILSGGDPYTIAPDDTRNMTVKVCRRGIWNEP